MSGVWCAAPDQVEVPVLVDDCELPLVAGPGLLERHLHHLLAVGVGPPVPQRLARVGVQQVDRLLVRLG